MCLKQLDSIPVLNNWIPNPSTKTGQLIWNTIGKFNAPKCGLRFITIVVNK